MPSALEKNACAINADLWGILTLPGFSSFSI